MDAGYGIEQFCVSVTWNGRVFLTSRPYTIDPACEHAIVEAVKSAPRCYFVVETDGKIGGITVGASEKEIGEQIRAAKNSATGSHNFTKNYNSQL